MKADYDSKGDTIQIDLEPGSGVDYGDDETDDWLVIGIRDGRAVRIDVIGTGGDVERSLRAAAQRYSLDAQALLAAARAALAAPDREVAVEVGVRAAA
jgi:hypothetical protein